MNATLDPGGRGQEETMTECWGGNDGNRKTRKRREIIALRCAGKVKKRSQRYTGNQSRVTTNESKSGGFLS